MLAEAGRGRTSPNPMVGAIVIDKRGVIIGRGSHEYVGGPHAEVNALNQAGMAAKGATLISTLEPCAHQGRTPPCVDMIISSGIKKVFIGALDPNPIVAGQGMKKLIESGLDTEVGTLESDVRRQNAGYFSLMENKRPFFIAKTAQTLNARLTIPNRRWVTSEASRHRVHEMRAGVDAIMVGVGTVLADDPMLTVRGIEKPHHEPARVIIDTSLRIPDNAKVLDSTATTIVYCGEEAAADRRQLLVERGIEVITVGEDDRGLDLTEIAANMAEREFLNVMVEGGPSILTSMLSGGLIDAWTMFLAPMVTIEKNSLSLTLPTDITDVYQFRILTTERIGGDLLVMMEKD